MKARRYQPDNLLPLELWDAMIDDTPLYLLPEAQQPAAIAKLVQQLARGQARRKRAGLQLARLSIERVVIAGGGSVHALRAALTGQGIEALVAEEPGFIAEPAGRALLASLCDVERGLVVDVGQTAIKVSTAEGRRRIERPRGLVPLELDAGEPALREHWRTKTVAFIASSLRCAPAPEGLVLAMPCEVDDALVVAGCSYPWQAGDARLVADILTEAGLLETPCLVLNDAELAALSVALRHPSSRATLVLTLGLGLGAAYLPGQQP